MAGHWHRTGAAERSRGITEIMCAFESVMPMTQPGLWAPLPPPPIPGAILNGASCWMGRSRTSFRRSPESIGTGADGLKVLKITHADERGRLKPRPGQRLTKVAQRGTGPS